MEMWHAQRPPPREMRDIGFRYRYSQRSCTLNFEGKSECEEARIEDLYGDMERGA